MKRIKRVFYVLPLWFCYLSLVQAQSFRPAVVPAGIIYNRERTLNLKITTNRGIAPGVEFGKLQTYYKTTYFQVNAGNIRHAKEQRQSAPPAPNYTLRPYIYGKRNSFLALRAGWGAKRYYSEKARQKGVALGISYSAGPTLGILKPYYLALRRKSDNPTQSRVTYEKYSDENASAFLDNTLIVGAGAFTRGLSEISFLPGGNASLAFHLDWGAFDEFVKALEIGVMADVFIKKAPILIADTQNNRTFVNFFVNLQFGKRK
jgi:hypothetical protein